MRHRREIGDHRIAGDVLAEDDRQLRGQILEILACDQFVQVDHLALDVGQLDPDNAPAGNRIDARRDRKSVVEGKSVSVRVDLGGLRHIKKKNTRSKIITNYETYNAITRNNE